MLASLAAGRLDEALRTAHARKGGQDVLDLVTSAVIATASGQSGWKSPLTPSQFEDTIRLSPRLRVLVRGLGISRDLREGRVDAARDSFRLLALTADPNDLAVALRIVSRQDISRLQELLKMVPETSDEIVAVVRASMSAPHVLSDELARVNLSTAETAVLTAARDGLSNQGIADQLFLSVNTVKTHLKSIYRCLGVRTRREAVSMAEWLGILGSN